MSIEPGSPAPAFDLPTDLGANLTLAGLKARKVVLYFYPKDDTTGCTNEAQQFSAAKAEFDQAGAVVVGVSKDTVKSHAKFRAKYDLKVELGSDEAGAAVEAYGVWVEKSMYGRQYMGIERATFLIDASGVVRRVWHKVKVAGHAQDVLKAVQELG
jgi:peroxiredoxin Q/BCP